MQEILSKKIIGERIKNLRIQQDLSQAFIAATLKISRSNYSQIELGNQFPSFNTLYLIARFYNKSYNWILHGETSVTQNEPPEIDSLITNMETTLTTLMSYLKNLEQQLIIIKSQRLKNTLDDAGLEREQL